MQHFSDHLSGPKPDEAGRLGGERGSSMHVALRERQTERQTETDTQRERDRDRDRQRERQTV